MKAALVGGGGHRVRCRVSLPPGNRRRRAAVDLLITNARIIDGTGGPLDDAARSASAMDASPPSARVTGSGGAHDRCAAARCSRQGFIDAHSHSDFSLLVDGNAESKIRQGVTTEVIGESGSVRAAAARRAPGEEPSDTRGTGVRPAWTDFAGYFAAVDGRKSPSNLLLYVGLGQVREFVMGNDDRAPTSDELAEDDRPRRQRDEAGRLRRRNRSDLLAERVREARRARGARRSPPPPPAACTPRTCATTATSCATASTKRSRSARALTSPSTSSTSRSPAAKISDG